jgi:hypothetical protein
MYKAAKSHLRYIITIWYPPGSSPYYNRWALIGKDTFRHKSGSILIDSYAIILCVASANQERQVMGKALGLFLSWILRAFGIFVIIVAWLAYIGLWEKIGSLSLDFINENLTMAIALTIAGVAFIAFSSSVVRFLWQK